MKIIKNIMKNEKFPPIVPNVKKTVSEKNVLLESVKRGDSWDYNGVWGQVGKNVRQNLYNEYILSKI